MQQLEQPSFSPWFRRFAKGTAWAEQCIYHPATGRLFSLDLRFTGDMPMWMEVKWGDADFHRSNMVKELERLRHIARNVEEWKLVLPGGVKKGPDGTIEINPKKVIDLPERKNLGDVGYLVTESVCDSQNENVERKAHI